MRSDQSRSVAYRSVTGYTAQMVRPRVENGLPVPDVSRRQMKTFDKLVDEIMERWPRVVMDLTDDDERDRFRASLRSVVRQVANEMRWSFVRATESALVQAEELMNDRNRYEQQVRRSKKEREKYDADRRAAELARRTRATERDENFRALADSGKLRVMPHLELRMPDRPRPTLATDDDAPPE